MGEDHVLSVAALGMAGIILLMERGLFTGLWGTTFILSWHELIFHAGYAAYGFLDNWFLVFIVMVPFLLYLKRWKVDRLFMLSTFAIMLPFFIFPFVNSLNPAYSSNLAVNGYEILSWASFGLIGCYRIK